MADRGRYWLRQFSILKSDSLRIDVVWVSGATLSNTVGDCHVQDGLASMRLDQIVKSSAKRSREISLSSLQTVQS